jgi:hypothetical protein
MLPRRPAAHRAALRRDADRYAVAAGNAPQIYRDPRRTFGVRHSRSEHRFYPLHSYFTGTGPPQRRLGCPARRRRSSSRAGNRFSPSRDGQVGRLAERAQSLVARRLGGGNARELVKQAAQASEEDGLLTYCSAPAFPLPRLAGPVVASRPSRPRGDRHASVWIDTVAPALHERVTPPVFHAIDYSALRVLNDGTAGSPTRSRRASSSGDLAWSIRTTMQALSSIHGLVEALVVLVGVQVDELLRERRESATTSG